MNKESILEAFYKDKTIPKEILMLLNQKNQFLNPIPQEPMNLKYENYDQKSQDHDFQSRRSSFSKIGISQEKYLEICSNRETRKVF